MEKTKQLRELTILQLMEVLAEKSNDSRLGEEFWNDNGAYAAELASRLLVKPRQAVLLSICLLKGPRRVDFEDISRHLDISNIRALNYSDDINALVHAKYLKYRDAKEEESFDIPVNVLRALKNNMPLEQPKRSGLTPAGLFDYMWGLYEDLYDNAILAGDLFHEMKDLFELNKELNFVREFNALNLTHYNDWMVLVCLCNLLVNKDDDEVNYGQIEDLYRSKGDFYDDKAAFRDGSHNLMQLGLVEHACDDGIANTNQIHLTGKAKAILLSDFHIRRSEMTMSGLIKPDTLAEKALFYTESNARHVDELRTFLMQDRYTQISARMKESGFRNGFACLFYGSPGTGKTETVYQLARQTGRSIMAVNIPDIKSKWVGESEKNIKEVFDRYRLAVQRSDLAPILLFNEADGILGIRQEGAQHAVDKMENSIQNIILQEIENLDGILIATTNLTQNLDQAFERRFLYKICFERPDAAVREKIWHTMIPSLPAQDCAALASAYDLSGGQMENVARKYSINSILYGNEKPPMDILSDYCKAERLEGSATHKIGF